jgi:hypothetical protein
VSADEETSSESAVARAGQSPCPNPPGGAARFQWPCGPAPHRSRPRVRSIPPRVGRTWIPVAAARRGHRCRYDAHGSLKRPTASTTWGFPGEAGKGRHHRLYASCTPILAVRPKTATIGVEFWLRATALGGAHICPHYLPIGHSRRLAGDPLKVHRREALSAEFVLPTTGPCAVYGVPRNFIFDLPHSVQP